ncbi:Rhodanese-like domain [Macleaya cordata]|uniref:Rhodanese-like domain n=1 Tax=Macleaya cordata TaxID=56857 RepID=A0A200QKU8_MACCD|nr:Rhodanese-like domain [Macleaya cordata]
MLPIFCSPTPSACSSHSQILFHFGLRPLSPLGKGINIRWILEGRVFLGVPNGISARRVSFKTQATKFVYSHVIERPEVSGSVELTNSSPHLNELYNLGPGFSNNWSDSIEAINGSMPMGRGELSYVESSGISAVEEKLLYLPDQLTYSTNELSADAAVDASENTTSISDSLVVADDALTKLKTIIGEFVSGVNVSIDASVDKGDRAVKNTLDAVTSLITNTAKSVTEAVDSSVNSLSFNVNQAGNLAGNGVTGFSGDLKEATSKASSVAIDVLRQTIVSVEDYLASGTTFVVYYYSSAKELLPPEVRNALTLTEEKAIQFLSPVKTAFKQQVYIVIEGLEANLGLDPNDPIIPFVLLLGTSATLGISYWILTYGGYSGDLSPQSTSELLTREENVVLIDIRPEARDYGVPDLRRGARFRYASVTLPEIDGSVRKLLVRGRDLDDALIAAVIRNLKIVRDRSKVIVMDADGTRSKGIARSLKKLGRPYLVHGGFRSWVKNGLRSKQLKPETTLTILNEEAEAILEEIRPTPLQTVGYGVPYLLLSCYNLVAEWERTLQLIGVIGLGQTIYKRVASYEDSEDFKQDVRLLLAPVTLGAEAFSWAARKLEPNRVGLPTSPSSSAVQDRVLQAAAKHESQPPDSEEMQDLSYESNAPVDENVDLSEA